MSENLTKLIDSIQTKIDNSISSFNGSIPEIQEQIYKRMQILLKDLEVDSNGNLKNTVQNVKAIAGLKSEIEKIILNKNYKNSVVDFAKSYDAVTALQQNYFNAIVKDFGQPKVIAAIKTDAINATINNLTESGIDANVTKGVQDLLRRNITSGGGYADMLDQMRSYLTDDKSGLGALSRYTKQITTDSLNQYSATYNSTIAADLNFEWYQYVGSNIETTRPFCKSLTKKRWIHRSELPAIIDGKIDGTQIPINPKTDVWYGGIPKTTVANFQINRGGYTCGHQLYPISEILVPLKVRMEVYSRLNITHDDKWMRKAA